MFIQTEATPNPATMKFLPGRAVLESGTLDMASKEAASQSPLAQRLFEIPNVAGVFFGADFISVTKADGEWQQLKPAILGAIMEHYMSGAPLVAHDAEQAAADEFFEPGDAETVATIKDLLRNQMLLIYKMQLQEVKLLRRKQRQQRVQRRTPLLQDHLPAVLVPQQHLLRY